MELINKSDIEEILRNLWKEDDGHNPEHRICYNKALQEVQCKLDSLKVKKVDLEKKFYDFLDTLTGKDNGHLSEDELFRIAEYFFELGMQTKEENTLAKAKGFLVRDKDDYTAIYSTKPERGKTEWVDGNHPRNTNESSCLFTMDARILPNVEFYDEPVEVEVTITKKEE